MTESVVREELEFLNIRIQGVTQLRSWHRDQDPTNDRPPTPLHCISGAKAWGVESAITHRILRLASTWLQKAQCNASATSALDTRSVTADTHPVASYVGLPPLLWMVYPSGNTQCCDCGGYDTANYRGCVKWKEAKAALTKQAPECSRQSFASDHPAAPKVHRRGPSAEQMDLGEERNCFSEGACRQSHHNSTPNPKSLSSTGHGGARAARPGLRSLSPNPQHHINRLLRSPRRKTQVSKPQPPNQHHTTW